MNSPISDPLVRSVLSEMHADARKDKFRLIKFLPEIVKGIIRPGGLEKNLSNTVLNHLYIPVSAQQGNLLYLIARMINAQTLVEFGTSYGISTMYLAAAAKINGGKVIGTELDEKKYLRAKQNLSRAGLGPFSEIRLGDARETLKTLEAKIDLLFLDGWKDLYLPILKQLLPSLRPGAVIVADNIFTFPKMLKPFVDFISESRNGFQSFTLDVGEGLQCAVYDAELIKKDLSVFTESSVRPIGRSLSPLISD